MDGSAGTAFELGWDHGRYGIRPTGAYPREFEDGMRAAEQHFGRGREAHDRFVRKWLLLRLNALRRGRTFESDVTPDFLRAIDVQYCPVTRELLTHGTGLPSDWSVDRVRNDGGYSRYNLIVMSARANEAKSSFGPTDIAVMHMVAPAEGRDSYGLTKDDWLRLTVLSSFVNPPPDVDTPGAARPYLPMALIPPPYVPMCDWVNFIQYMLCCEVLGSPGNPRAPMRHDGFMQGKKGKAIYREAAMALRGASAGIARRMDTSIPAKVRAKHAVEDAWRHELVERNFTKLIRAVESSNAVDRVGEHYQRRSIEGKTVRVEYATYRDSLHLSEGGYVQG